MCFLLSKQCLSHLFKTNTAFPFTPMFILRVAEKSFFIKKFLIKIWWLYMPTVFKGVKKLKISK